MMKKPVPNWLAVLVILAVIAIVAGVYVLSGRQRSQEVPEGFKPKPPMFKAAPAEKR